MNQQADKQGFPSIEEQVATIQRILGTEANDYYLKGRTYPHKADIIAWGGHYDHDVKAWRFEGIQPHDSAYKVFDGVEGLWWERIKTRKKRK